MTVLSEGKLSELALHAYLMFGCTCGSPSPEAREAMDGMLARSPTTTRPILMALATHHFRLCVYDEQHLLDLTDGQIRWKAKR